MAEFSKQWCEINDPDMPWDFDIDELAKKLRPGSYMHAICEGIGFHIIARNEEGELLLGFVPDWDAGEVEYKTYKEVIDGSICSRHSSSKYYC